MEETQVKENVNVTSKFVDQVEPAVAGAQIIPRGLEVDPYEKDEMTRMLSRTYQLGSYTWSASDAADTCLAAFRFPEALFAEPNLWAKLQRYQYFRGGVRVSIRISATRFHYGTLLASWLPYYDLTSSAAARKTGEWVGKFRSFRNMANNPSAIISANAGDAVEFEIPWRAPMLYVPIDRYQSGLINAGTIGSVAIRVLTPLRLVSSENTPIVKFVVTASFVEPEVAGFQIASRAAYAPTVNQAANIMSQAKKVRQEAVAKSEEHLISGTLEGTSKILAKVESWPIVGGVAGVAGKVFKFLGAGARAIGFDKPTAVEAPTLVEPGVARDLAFVSGLSHSQLLAARPENVVSQEPTLLRMDDDETKISHLATRMFLVDTLSFTSASTTGSSLLSVPVTPMLCYGGSDSTKWKCEPTIPCWFGCFFRFWRGSMKYRIRFVCSSVTSARLRIGWHPESSNLPASYTAGVGDFVNMVVDVEGDTEVEFTVPYLQNDMWKLGGFPVSFNNGSVALSMSDAYSNGTLSVTVVNPATTADDTLDSTVYVIWQQTIGEDFQFASPFSPIGWTTCYDDLAAQGSYTKMTSNSKVAGSSFNFGVPVFDPIVPALATRDSGVCMGEEIDDVRELMRRFSLKGTATVTAASVSASNSGTNVVNPFNSYITTASAGIAISAPFMFVRGKYRQKFLTNTGDLMFATVDYGTGNGSGAINVDANFNYLSGWRGTGAVSRSVAGELDIEVPYYTPWIYEVPKWNVSGTQTGNHMCGRSVRLLADTSDSHYVLFEAAGDDFDMGTLSAPPSLWSTSGTIPTVTRGVYPA